MPVLHQEGYLSADDVPAMEILQRRSINSLFGLPEGFAIGSPEPDPDPFRFDAPRSFRIPIGRVPVLDEFPDGPEGGRIPAFGWPAGRGGGDPDSPDSSASARSNRDAPAADPMATDFERLLSISPRERRRARPAPARDCAEAGPRAAAFAWRGSLPFRARFPSGGLSPKIFLGGLPWDADEKTLVHTFRRFGPIRVDWPGRESDSPQPKGFVYAVFQTERQVRCLLAASVCDGAGDWYFAVSTRKMRSKQVQIIPWDLRDSNFVKDASVKLDPSRTVFVGALHGMLTAEGLARIMDDLFGGVVFAGIDTDRHKYPIGSGRVTFDNARSYARAVGAAFVDVKTEKFRKKIQVDPYLEDSICSVCNVQQGPYFCRTPSCFEYFCRSCWQWRHARDRHRPLTRSKCPPPRRDSAPSRGLGGDSASARGLGGDAR